MKRGMSRFFSILLIVVMLIGMIPFSPHHEHAHAATPGTLYFQSNGWESDGARIEAYFFGGSSGDKWVTMTNLGNGYFKCSAPTSGYPKVIFVRMNPSGTEHNWDSKWNQTADLTLPTDGKDCFSVSGWDNASGTWGYYVCMTGTHNYAAATCTKAKTCKNCGATSGSSLGHSYAAATCTAAKTCTRCGVTSGSALGHSWSSSTGKCTRCSTACSHSWNSGTVTKAATCAATGVRTYTCNTCKTTKTETIPKTTNHNYAAATCTVAKKCTVCGITSGSALGHSWSSSTGKCTRCSTACSHSWNSGTVTKAATCAATGVRTYTCNTCKTTKTETIPKTTNHNYAAATCTVAKKCTVCGVTTGSALGHSYSYKVTKNPTTSAAGTLVGTCTRSGCGASTGNITIGYLCTTYHTYKVITAAGCTTTGTGRYTWKITDYGTYYWDVSIPAAGHSYTSTVTAPTCTAQGYTTYTCSKCSNSYKDNYTAAKGHSWSSSTGKCSTCGTACSHSWNSGSITTQPGCTTEGVKTYTCNTCKTTKTESVAAMGHSYSGGKCGNCGDTKTVSLPGSFNDWNTNATMTWGSGGYTYSLTLSAGTYTFKVLKDGAWLGNNGEIWDTTTATSSVGWEFVDGYNDCVLVATGGTYNFTFNYDTNMLVITYNHTHSYTAGEVVAPTCTAKGYTVYTCACGDSYNGDETAAKGHSWNSGSITTQPGCTTEGVKTYTCNTCGTTKTESVAAAGHSYSSVVTKPTCTAQGYTTYTCSKCNNSYKDNYKDATGHSYTSKVTTAASCTTAGVRTYTCSNGCGSSYTEEIAALGHSYSSKVTAPTCTAQGYTTHTCGTCGNSYKDTYTDATGHSYVNGTCSKCGNGCSHNWGTGSVTTQPGCTTTGVRTYTCSVCKHTKTESIAANGHSYSSKVTAPTCTAQGYTTYTCSVCSHSYKDSYTDAKGHSWNASTGKCSTCGTECDHSWNSGSVTTQPGCITEGVKTYTCNTCKATKTESVAALGHSYSGGKCGTCGDVKTVSLAGTFNDWAAADMTWSENGYTYTMTLSAGTYTFKIIKDGTWLGNNGTIEDTTTATSDIGWEFVDAGDCTLIATGGSYTFTFNFDTNMLVIVNSHTHSYNAGQVVAPTCTAGGYTVYTCACGDSYQGDKTDALNHSYTSQVTTQPGCTTEGVKTFTCSRCDHSYTEVVAALGHSYTGGKCGSCGDTKTVSLPGSFNEWNANATMTWTESGYTYEMVLSAGTYTFKVLKDGAWLGNNGEIWDTTTATSDIGWEFAENTNDGTLVATGGTYYFTFHYDTNMLVITYNHSHSYTAGEVVAPTCTAGGYTVYTCACGDSYQGDKTAALNHSYSSQVTTQPGCTTEGVRTFTCGACGHSYTEPVASIGHDYKATVTAPTCTEQGYTTHKCANCGDSYTDTYTDAKGHSYVNGTCSVCGNGCSHDWGTGKVTTAATCTSTGVRTYTCSVCNHTKTESIPALSHTEVIDAGKDATCTETGLTMGKHCSVCGEVTVAQTEIPALGHSYTGGKCGTCGDTKTVSLPGSFNEWNANATMTWTENGYTCTMTLSAGTYTFKVLKDGAWLGNPGTIYDNTSAAENGWKFEEAGDCTLIATGGSYTFTFHFDTDMLVVTNNHTHSHTAGEVTAPTCTEQGYTTYTCACGDSYRDDYVDALGHSYVAGKCTACGDQLSLYLIGFINGADYDGDDYLFADGKLVITFTEGSYVMIKAGTFFYNAPAYVEGATSATLYPASESVYEKLFVPGNAEITFTLTAGEGDSFVLSYEISNCPHDYTAEQTKAPTCTEKGENTYTCSICGHIYTEEIAALGHDYKSETTAPTCTEQGYTTYTCACGDSYQDDYVDALGHSYVAGKCTACGDQLSLYLIGFINGADYDGDDYLFADGKLVITFTEGSYVMIKAGTFFYNAPAYVEGATSATLYPASESVYEKLFVPGNAEITFTLTAGEGDSFVLSYEISNCPHDYTAEQTKAPTCTEKGENTYTCSICGHIYTEEIAALGHDYKSETTAPTCTEQGYTTYTCACGDSYRDDYVDALGHSFGDDNVCDNCGHTSSVEYMNIYFRNDWLWTNVSLYYWGSTGTDNPAWAGIPMELHGNDGTFDIYVLKVPTDISGLLFTGISNEGAEVQSPDITSGWYDGICYFMYWAGEDTVLSDSIENVLPAECQHPNTTPVAGKEATCTEPGLTEGSICADCGETVVEQVEIPAKNHSYIAGTCANCGDQLSMYLIGFINGADYDGDEYLFADGKLVITFTEGSYVMIKAGTYWYNAAEFVEGATSATLYPASESVYEKLFVPGNAEITFTLTAGEGDSLVLSYVTGDCQHSYESTVTEPTCTEGGYTEHTCVYCGDSYTDTVTEALGHNYVEGICDRCGEAEPVVNYITVYFQNNWLWTGVYAYVYVGETYVTPWPGEPATLYGNDGEFDVYCVTIPEGHSVIFNGTDTNGNHDQTPDIDNAQDGDCYWMVWVDENTVEKDHIDNIFKPECTHANTTPVAGKDATCTEPGLTEGSVCADCGETVVEQTEIPALGHSYGDDEICDICGAQKPADYMTVYFRNDWLWTDVKLYYWGSTIAENPAWNGIAMELYGNDGQYDVYKLSVPTDITGLLFNGINTDGAEAQSPDVTSGWYDGICYYMFWDGADQILSDSIENILPDVCEHDYDVVTNEATCTADGSVTYTCKLCGDTKTEILPATGHNYVNGVCHCGATTDGVTIHLINTLGWSGTVAYAWEYSTSTALNGWGWPGKIIHKDNEGYFTFHVDYEPGSGKALGLLFHNFNGAQTVDIVIDYATLSTSREIWIKPSTSANADGKFACTVAGSESGLVVSPEVNGNQVTFRYAGTASSVFLAGSFNNWSTSATALTKGEDGIWSVTLNLDAGVHEYKFVADGSWIADPVNGVVGGYDGNSIVVVPADDETANTGKVTVVLHFYRSSGDYAGWDTWFWSTASNGTSATFSADPNNKGMIATFTVDGGTTSSVGFIVRKSDWSSQEFGDRFIDLTDVSSGTVHYYVNSGSATGLRVLGEDIFSAAKPVYANYNYEAGTIWLKTSLPVSNPVASAFSIVDGNGNATSVSVTGVTLSGNGYALTLSKGLTLSQLNSYKVRYNGCDATISINVHDLFYSSKFANDYTYYGDDLGATWSYGSTTFKVWAPTAKAVSVKIYSSGNWGANDLLQNVAMTQGDKGVWYVTVSGNLHGKYYNYDVSFEGYTVEATDPYAKGAGVNGDRGMIVNMDATDPSGWDNDVSPNQGMSYTDAIIYETHIREFTIDPSSGVDAAYRGKYLGLIQSGTSYQGYSTGLDYLKKLGITHIQLMPTYDFASIDEYHLTDWEQYAWGYDPKNFSVPEGSYSTNPYNGITRITEFKEMVQTFHENGINVVMDVVYNHTFDGGNYCGNKIVPNYYSRFFGEGNWSNGSGVGNDFATERTMVRNLIVDNVLYWVEEYHIDGFRFDLAGLIDVQTINEIVSTVHAKYPYVMFYGEGWAPGGTAVQDNHALATKGNAWQTGGFGYFNDDFRNAIAGTNGNSWGFASGSWEFEDAIANYFRAGNSFSSSPSQTINYVSCHDNYCLTDKLLISRNGAYWSEIVKMNSLSNALVLLSEGIPFIYSGDEMLREKKDGDGNRYDNAYGTNDYINKIRWDDLVNKQYASTVSDYYAGLIEFRKNHAALRSNNNGYIYSDVAYHRISDQTILFYINGSLNGDCSDGIVVIFNAAASSVSVDLSNYGLPNGYWQACIHGDKAGINPLWGVNVGSAEDTIGVDAISTTVLVLGDLVDEGSIYNRQPSSCSHANHNTSAMCTSCGKTVSHSYVGGTCSVCGLSSSAPSTYTVYFDNSVTNWQSVNIYAWTKTAGMTKEYTGTWSGAIMTLVDEANGIWAYELPIGASNIIFNDGSGNQSSDLTAPGYTSDKVLYSDGSWTTYEACAHEYEDTVNYEATCTMDGEVTHTCKLCGYSYTEVIQAPGHDITDEVIEPTCTTGGYTIHSCANCDYSVTDSETAKLGHSYDENGICGTCGAELKYYLFGYINGANYGSDGDEATMGNYIFADGQLTATFTQSSYVAVKTTDNEKWYMTNGYHEGVTSVTLYDTSVGIDANKLPVPGGIEITFTLTVNVDGTLTLSYTADTATCQHLSHSTEGICDVCGVEVEHKYEDGKCQCGLECEHDWTFGTCGNCGMVCEHSFEEGVCSICGAIDPETCEHVYESITVEPTCTAGGYTTHTCTLCGHSYTDSETEPAGHSYGEDGICTGCGKVNPDTCQHEYDAVVTEPTCTVGGFTTYTCTLCGHSYTGDNTEPSDHTYGEDGICTGCGKVNPDTCVHEYEDTVTEPTCTEPGYTTHTCTICGNSYTDTETQALGHSYGEDDLCTGCGLANPETCVHEYENVVTEPTCTDPGYTTHTCKLCGTSYIDTETEATGHEYDENGVCVHCGEITDCVHEYESVTVEPTCEEEGYTTHTCKLCGHAYTDSIVEALGHDYVDGTCTVCGGKDTENCEHEYIKTTVTASCTEPGGDKYTCSKCGDSYLENATDALGHTYENGICSVCGDLKPLSTTYYLVGWINGGNHGCEEDGANMGNYPITDNMFKYTFDQTSYVFLKTEGNGKWFMCDGYPGDGVCFANLYDTSLPINHDKVNVPGGIEITFTLIERDDGSVTLTYVTAGNCSHNWYTQTLEWPGCTTTGTMLHRCIMCAESYTTTIPAKGHSYNGGSNCWDCGAANPNYNPGYYLVGWINGSNVGCEENWDQPGYSFSGGRLTVTFTDVSYVYLKTKDNAKWYMTNGYPGDDATSAKFYDTNSGIDQNKLRVPAGVPITFYLTKNSDGSLTLSYTKGSCNHDYSSYISTAPGCTTTGVRTYNCSKCGDSYDEILSANGHNYVDGACAGCGDITADYVKNYYLYGWINGANYGCEDDYANMGQYKFVDGKLVCMFEQDSYVAVKTSGNQSWYMAQSYIDATAGTFYNTSTGAAEKMFVPKGMTITFTLTVNADDTLTLSYTATTCEHTYDEGVVTTEPTCNAEGVKTFTCSQCGNSYTEAVEMIPHTFEGDTCTGCGMVCEHTYEMTVIDATCIAYADYKFVCSNCGNTIVLNAEDMDDWMDAIPKLMPAELFEIGTLYRYRDYLTLISNEPTVEGYEVVMSYWASAGMENMMYVAQWPAGFDTTSELYAQYGTKLEAFETESEKLEILSDELAGYIYYHWHNAEGAISDVQTEEFNQFCAFFSDIAPDALTANEENLSYEFGGENCDISGWYFVIEVYQQTAERSVKEYLHGKWDEWTDYSEEEAIASETRQVETKTVYRLPDVKLGEHVYESEITAPTCTEPGYTTHTCTVCGDSYTDSQTEPTGHSYGEDGFCGVCGAEKPAEYMTIYFQNNWNWSDVKLYYWGSTIAENPEWPGIAMELYGNDGTYDIYCLTIPTDITGLIIDGIKDDGSEALDQTPDILEGWYDGICYYMTWEDGNAVGSEPIENVMPDCEHSYDEGTVTTEATCTTAGVKTYTCQLCGGTKTEEIPALGHSYGDDSICDICGQEQVVVQTMTIYFRNNWLWKNVCLYYWIDGVETPSWPGTDMELCGNDGTYDIYKLTIPANITGLIINGTNTDGNDDQTPDILEGWYDGICYSMIWNDGNAVVSENIGVILPSDEPVVVPTITVGNPSVSFEGEIRYNFYFLVDDMSSVEEMGLALFREKLTDGTVSTAFQVISTFEQVGEIYMVHTDGIAPKNMADAVYFKIYAKLTDGTYVYSTIRGYNAVVYANNILKKSDSVQMKALVVAMLNYGTEAQKYFGYNTDALMNAHLTAQQQALVAAYDESMVNPVLAVDMNKVGAFARTETGFTGRRPSVTFDGAFSINYYMTTAFAPEGDVKLYVWRLEDYLSADVLTAENASECLTMVPTGSENQYWANVSDIVAVDVDQTVFAACVYTSGGVTYCSGVLNYSVGAYCQSGVALNDSGSNLCAAAAVYCHYAKEYFASLEAEETP